MEQRGTAITRCPFVLYGLLESGKVGADRGGATGGCVESSLGWEQNSMRIDLNADVGESFGPYVIGHDEELLRSVTSANVAAGVHGGDPSVLRATIRLARAHGVAVGVHPGLPDRAGFGRREMAVSPAEAEDLVLYQLAAVGGVARAEGVGLQHVKPHGALFHMAARRADLADAIARAVTAFDASLILFGPAGSELLHVGRSRGLRVAAEVFADRAYQSDGMLVSRRLPGSVIDDPGTVVNRAIRMVKDRTVLAVDGGLVRLDADTICVHGDTPGAGILAAQLRRGLEQAGVTVKALGTV